MDRIQPPGHEDDVTTQAPGELELVRGFLALHDHAGADPASLPPSPETLVTWLRDRSLIPNRGRVEAEDLRWAASVREDLRALVGAAPSPGGRRGPLRRLDLAATEAGVELRFEGPQLAASTKGMRGAIGTLLAIAFLAQLDGSWERLRHCANPTCTSIFYDGSKNRSGRWCSMRSCGNQAKVRAFRERRRAEAT